MQGIIVGIVVAAAALYVLSRYTRIFRRKTRKDGQSCGECCGCSGGQEKEC